MKKVLGIIALFISAFSLSVSAAAIDADYEFYSTENAYVVYGTSSDEKSGDEITIEVKLNDNVIDTVVTETYLDDGQMKYESPLILIDSSVKSGKISFNVYSANYDSPVILPKDGEEEILYYGIDNSLYTVLAEIDELLPVSDESEYKSLINVIKSNSELLGLSREAGILNSLRKNSEKSMYEYAKTISMNKLPSGVSTDEEIKEVFEYVLMFRAKICNMLLFGEFTNISVCADFISWYEKYEELIDLENTNKEYYEYFEENYKKSEYFSILQSKSMIFGNEGELKSRLFEAAALTSVANGNAAVVEKVFDVFENEIDTSYHLTDVQKSNVFRKMSGQTYSSFDEFSKDYDEKAKALLNKPSGGSGSSSGSGGNSNRKPAVMFSQTGSDNTQQEEINKEHFIDMESAAWAKDAVYTLFKKGIVSGRTENTFEPNANITRAEFIKLLVGSGDGLKQGTEQIFSDVNKDSWYYDYVNTAYFEGYATGYEDGSFAPSDNITRQDMAVLIYRYLGSPETVLDLAQFSDSEEISDYAKTAVSYLYGKNVINGMGDGTFSPKDRATRAEAAQMIYKVIS